MTGAVEELRHDHEALRRALADVERLLTAPGTGDVTQAKYRFLMRLLERHLQREAEVIAPYASRIAAALSSHPLHDHAPPRVVLRDLGVLFSAKRMVPTGPLVIHLCRLLDELRESLVDEEREVFPIVQHTEDVACSPAERRAANPGGSYANS